MKYQCLIYETRRKFRRTNWKSSTKGTFKSANNNYWEEQKVRCLEKERTLTKKSRRMRKGMKTSRTNFSPAWIVNRCRIKRTSRQPEIKTMVEEEENEQKDEEGSVGGVRRETWKYPSCVLARLLSFLFVQPLLTTPALSQLPPSSWLCAPTAAFEFTSRRNLYENLTMLGLSSLAFKSSSGPSSLLSSFTHVHTYVYIHILTKTVCTRSYTTK